MWTHPLSRNDGFLSVLCLFAACALAGLGGVPACTEYEPDVGDDDGVGDDDSAVGDDDDSAADDDDTGDDDSAADDDDSAGDDDTEPPSFRIEGDVYVIPVTYEEDEDGNEVRVELEWTDIHEDGYPFGWIYVAVTPDRTDTVTTLMNRVIDTVPADPKTVPCPYHFEAETWPQELVSVMAAVDDHYDGVISSWDARSFYPGRVVITPMPITGADIYVDVHYVWGDGGEGGGGWWPGPGHCIGCGTPGDPLVQTTLSGEVYLDESVVGSGSHDTLVATFDEWLDGPYWTTQPGPLDAANPGELLPWTITVNADWTSNVLGAWDSNGNGLFEPTDTWGATVNANDGSTVNPWTIEQTAIDGMLVQVPVAGQSIPAPQSYVTISGVVTTDGSYEFADLDPSWMLGVVALKVYPDLDGTIASMLDENALWGYSIVGDASTYVDSIPYSVQVPTNVSLMLTARFGTEEDEPSIDGYVIDAPLFVHMLDVETSNITQDMVMTYLEWM